MKQKQWKARQSEQGFTLVELSIVLVIIGLIVGGVLVGQALIEAARIRAGMTQIEGFNSAINTFRSKYNALPGDLPAAQATAYGFAAGGNGNGVIDDGETPNTNTWAAELPAVWNHLSRESLVNGSYDGATDAIGSGFPAFRVGQGGVLLGSIGAQNVYRIAAYTDDSQDFTDILLPAVAFQIDNKFDDGLPNSGIVRAQGSGGFQDDTADTTNCVVGTDQVAANNLYLVGNAEGTCGMRIRVSG